STAVGLWAFARSERVCRERGGGGRFPPGGPGGGAEEPPLPIDQVYGRRAPHAVYASAGVAALVEQHRRDVAALGDRLAHELGALAKVDEPDFQTAGPVLLIQRVDGR